MKQHKRGKLLTVLNKFLITLCGLLYASTVLMAEEITIQDVYIDTENDYTEVILSIDGAFNYHSFSLTQPDRLVIDLSQTALKASLDALDLSATPIEGIRAANHQDTDSLRMVFDLKKVQSVSIQKSTRHDGQQVLVIIFSDRDANIKPKVIIPTRNDLRNIVVIIDPGHGGRDPGAIGQAQGLREKNVVFAIAKALQQNINTQPGMSAILTRDGDHFVPLRNRLEIARTDHADIFVSIHADAFANAQASGASVYTLSAYGATSEAAQWLAEKENHSELGGVNLNDLDDENDILRSLLIDLSQTATVGESLQLGQAILNQLGTVTNLHQNHVEQAGFLVLKSPDVPSVLIETGFLSNPTEELNLGSQNFRGQLAQAITQGIESYMMAQPPPGSLLEMLSHSEVYEVLPGDNLSMLAYQANTTVDILRKLNGLDNDTLHVGDKLYVPQRA